MAHLTARSPANQRALGGLGESMLKS